MWGVKSTNVLSPIDWFVIVAIIFRYGIKPPLGVPFGVFMLSQLTLASIWTLVFSSSKLFSLGNTMSLIAPSKIILIPGSILSSPITNSWEKTLKQNKEE